MWGFTPLASDAGSWLHEVALWPMSEGLMGSCSESRQLLLPGYIA